jgi:DNA-binding NtrC family response regulator
MPSVANGNNKPRVLIVDDNENLARILTSILNIKGYQAQAIYRGSKALEEIDRHHWDCVISDIKMPDIDGVQLCKIIKASHPDLPVVLMTAYSSTGVVDEGLREGALACLSKPCDIDQVLVLLKDTVGR